MGDKSGVGPWVLGLVAALAVIVPVCLVIILFAQLSPISSAFIGALASVPRVGGLLRPDQILAGLTLLLAVCLHQASWLTWESSGARWSAWWAIVVLAVTTGVFMVPFFPVVATAGLILVGPAILYFIRSCVVPEADTVEWYRAASMACFISELLCVAVWVTWMVFDLNGESWTDWTPTYRQMVLRSDITWKMAFVAWILPLAMSFELGLAAALLWMRRRHAELVLSAASDLPGVGERLTPGQAYLVSAVRQLALWVMAGLLIMWVSASIEATGETQFGQRKEDLRDEVMIIMVFVFVGVAVWAAETIGYREISIAAQQSKVAKQVVDAAQSDWAKAMLILLAAPLILVALLMDSVCPSKASSAVAQFCSGCCWTSVAVKALWLGVLFLSVQVGVMKVTLVFLAWVVENIVVFWLWQVVVIIWLVAYVLFFHPVAPGPPIYVVMGMVITASAMQEGWSFAGAWALSTIAAYTMKLAFTASAQKFIGGPLANSVWIRHLVGVHTIEIRAIGVVLRNPTPTFPKVFLLMGAPDWPVAVLSGILRCSVLEIQLGISPVLFQSVIPSVTSGALLYVASGRRRYLALAETAIAIAGFLQVSCAVIAGYFIQEIIESRYDELKEPREEDREVVELDEKLQAENRAFQRETAWEMLPFLMKVALALGFVFMEASILILTLPWEKWVGVACFQDFNLTSSVTRDLHGNVLNLVLPLGWLALALFAVPCFALCAFYAWVQVNVKRWAEMREEGERMLLA